MNQMWLPLQKVGIPSFSVPLMEFEEQLDSPGPVFFEEERKEDAVESKETPRSEERSPLKIREEPEEDDDPKFDHKDLEEAGQGGLF